MARLLFALWLLLALSSPAEAAPVVTAIAGFLTSTGVFGAAAANAIAGWLVRTVASAAISRLSMALKKKQSVQQPGIRTETTQSGGTSPMRFILGLYATGGQLIAPPNSWGDDGDNPRAYLVYPVALSVIPGCTLTRIIVNDSYVTLQAASKAEWGRDAEGDFSGKIQIDYLDGSQTSPDADMLTAFGADPDRPWSADMIGTGLAWAKCRFNYSREHWNGLPSVRFEVMGIPLYDPRKDSTAGGSGSHRWTNRASWTQTVNPIVMVWNIMRGIEVSPGLVWGGGYEPEDLPAAAWFAAMNACDLEIDDGNGGTVPQFRAGLEVALDDEPLEVVAELLKAACAEMAEIGGYWDIRVGAPRLPVMVITDDDILATREQEQNPFPSLTDTYNGITASYPEPESLWEAKDAPPRYNAEWEAEDGGRRLVAEMQLTACPWGEQVQRIMAAVIGDHRRFGRLRCVLPPEALVLSPLDTIALTSARYGYIAKPFELRSVADSLMTLRQGLSVREVDGGDFAWTPGNLIPSLPVPTVTTPPVPQAVPGFAAAPATVTGAASEARRPAIDLIWDPAGAIDARGIGWQLRLAGDTGEGVPGSHGVFADGRLRLTGGVLPATGYEVRAKLIVDRAALWTPWLPVTTPDIRVTADDLSDEVIALLDRLNAWIEGGVEDLPGDLAGQAGAIQAQIEALTAETTARSEETREAADRWRQTHDLMRTLAAEVLDLASADHTAREDIRRSLTVQVEAFRANYTEQITVLADADQAAATRLETLEAGSDDLAAAIQQVDAARVAGEEALAQSLASLSVGTATQFDHTAIWHFDTAVEGWTGNPADPAWQTGGRLRPAGGASGYLASPAGLAVNGARYRQVRLRLLRTGAPAWTGWLWWAAAGEGWDTSRRVAMPEPVWESGVGLITVDAGWAGTVDRIRLDLADTTGSAWADIDWIAIGRPAPGASSADLDVLRQVVITGDSALGEEVGQLGVALTDTNTGLAATAGAVDALDVRVGNTEDGIAAAAEQLNALNSAINNPDTGLDAQGEAIDRLTAGAEAAAGGQSVQAGALRDLRSILRGIAAEGVEAAAREALGLQQVRAYTAQAAQDLNTRIDLTDNQVRIVAQAVTLLQAAIPGLASADALAALVTTVTQQGQDLAAVSQSIVNLSASLTALTGTVGAKADATALQTLTARVVAAEGAVGAQSEALTSLGVLTGEGVAQTILRMTAEASPEGVAARIGLKALAGDSSDTARAAALFLEALAGGGSRVVIEGDALYLMIGGSATPLFIADESGVRFNSALIRLTGDTEVDGSFRVTGPMIDNGATTRRQLMPVLTSKTVTELAASPADLLPEKDVSFETDSPVLLLIFGILRCDTAPAKLQFRVEGNIAPAPSAGEWGLVAGFQPFEVLTDTHERHTSLFFTYTVAAPANFYRLRLRGHVESAAPFSSHPVTVSRISLFAQQVNR